MKFFDVFSELFSNEFTLESEYIKQNIPIKIKHKECGYEFSILPQSISRNKSCVCPKCNPSAIKHVIKGINDNTRIDKVEQKFTQEFSLVFINLKSLCKYKTTKPDYKHCN